MINIHIHLWTPVSVPRFALITAPVLTLYSQVETLRSQWIALITEITHWSLFSTYWRYTNKIIIIIMSFFVGRTVACSTIGYHSNSWASCYTLASPAMGHWGTSPSTSNSLTFWVKFRVAQALTLVFVYDQPTGTVSLYLAVDSARIMAVGRSTIRRPDSLELATPDELRNSDSFDNFKRFIKTILFSRY